MTQIVDIIKSQDREALKSLFSRKALEEAEGFDGKMDDFFSFIQGDINSWESTGWSSNGAIEYGKRTLSIQSGFSIETDIANYTIFVIDYYIDTIEPDNEGIFMIQIRTTEYTKDIGSWQERMRAGFYFPEAE